MSSLRDYENRLLREMVMPKMIFLDEHHWSTPKPKAAIPPLDVPKEPEAAQPEPESASVQLLRSLLTDRRAEREKVDGARRSLEAEVKRIEEQLAGIRSRIAQDERHIAAADEAITVILSDIDKLGGRPETAD